MPVRFFYLYVRESGAVLFLYHRHEYGCIGGADRGCKSVGEGSRQLFVEACYAGVHFYAGSCIYRLGTADERKLYLLASGRTGCERGCLGRHQYCDFSDAVCLCTVRTPCQLCQLLLNNGWVCRIFSSMLGSTFVALAKDIRILNIPVDNIQMVFILSAFGIIASALYSRKIKEK